MQLLVDTGFGNSLSGQNTPLIKCGTQLMEWAARKQAELGGRDQRLLGKCHFELWRVSTFTADPFNLTRADVWYDLAMHHMENVIDVTFWIEYSRVLESMGDSKKAVTIVQRLLFSFEESPEISTYLLYAGSALKVPATHFSYRLYTATLFCIQTLTHLSLHTHAWKAQGDFDRAGSYFFEAMNLGPPRQFTRVDMLFIVARTLEESSQVVAATSGGEPEMSGYRMCYDYIVEDGLVARGTSFDDWIGDCQTWCNVADKCALHHCFTLAADLYGRGLYRDKKAFQRPTLWVRFAKANFRCGRLAEGKVGLKQALSIDPYNSQIKEQLRIWEFHGKDEEGDATSAAPAPVDDPVDDTPTALKFVLDDLSLKVHIDP